MARKVLKTRLFRNVIPMLVDSPMAMHLAFSEPPMSLTTQFESTNSASPAATLCVTELIFTLRRPLRQNTMATKFTLSVSLNLARARMSSAKAISPS